MKNIYLFGLGFIILSVAAGIYLIKTGQKPIQKEETIITEQSTPMPTGGVTESVPLPTGEDIIRSFFTLINEKRYDDAISMMEDKMVGDTQTKDMWKKQYSAMKSVNVTSIAPYNPIVLGVEEQYAVTIDMIMTAESANEPIPFYGYENGKNMRFVTVTKSDKGVWKIAGIATGN